MRATRSLDPTFRLNIIFSLARRVHHAPPFA